MKNLFLQEITGESAEKYSNLLSALKVGREDAEILQRYLISETFVANQGLLASFTAKLTEMINSLGKIGITLGIKEPSIKEALNYERCLSVEFRDAKETFEEMFKLCEFLYHEMKEIVNELDFPIEVRTMIMDYQICLRNYAAHDANQALMGGAGL